MTNFWAQRLGVQPAPQQVQPATTHNVQPWWAPQALAPQPVPMPQVPGIPGYPPVPMPQVPGIPGQQPVPMPQVEEHHGWGNPEKSRAKAKSSRLTSVCANCGSGNVFRPTPNSMEQCYDCGENPRFSQMGGEGGMPSEVSGPTQQARQVSGGGGAGGQSNFNPGQIVGRI